MRTLCWIALFLLLLLTGCATREIAVVTTPAGATVTATGQRTKVVRTDTGARITLSGTTDPVTVRVSAPDYQAVEVQVMPRQVDPKKPLRIVLPKFREVKEFSFSSEPYGATVLVDNAAIGQTPLTRALDFTRASEAEQWPVKTVSYVLEDWETASFTLARTDPPNPPMRTLNRLRHVVPLAVTAKTAAGQTLPAEMLLDGVVKGVTPLTVPLEYRRSSGSDPWPVFNVAVGITDRYIAQTTQLRYPGRDRLDLTLSPVIELPVARAFPVVQMTPQGAQIAWDESTRLGAIESGERLSTIADLRALTQFDREDPRQSCVNSFTLTPDGQHIIYGVTYSTDTGRYSNLWQSSAQSLSASRRQITEGPYVDSHPVMGNRPGTETVVFQSNRGLRQSIDISSIRIVQGQVLGGVRQLTREQRFNYSPVYTNEDWEVFFVSMEDRFALARPQISFMGMDGSLPTYLSEHGEDLTMSPDGSTIYFSRLEPATGNVQIYSIPKEGRPITQVITRSVFMQANCFNPSISPDGKHMLFVSDVDTDYQDRRNNNIYLLNIESGNVSQITQNFSDDIAPQWSPVEPNVLFFLSNRGGSYNIWRVKLAALE